jgi:hypothetical protein
VEGKMSKIKMSKRKISKDKNIEKLKYRETECPK